ncbi:hypothetical protein LEMA_P095510.1 [Plenodomus lingam JN3]|uniref:Uncharacterized protein n=1 Tax=Leptosphaeria maculans (strain JN3 / isolate v23.1.3 / race Av1-4-5-6-7-8) TaxID=985895 RepID=E5A3C9_LEPMJ|nr:hypothetical protein LEMA_P095510.1 [Plenodomus lingam JN3]CBX98142.1 hypothetical protein LEMA_P095510.1 [Plenodomus lingam JN3]
MRQRIDKAVSPAHREAIAEIPSTWLYHTNAISKHRGHAIILSNFSLIVVPSLHWRGSSEVRMLLVAQTDQITLVFAV